MNIVLQRKAENLTRFMRITNMIILTVSNLSFVQVMRANYSK